MIELIYVWMIVGLVIDIIAAVVIAKDARQRGMSEFGWFLGVFLVLIIFLPVYLVVRKPVLPSVIEQEQLESGNARKCPFCAEVIKIEAHVCRFCGRELVDVGGGARITTRVKHLETLPSVCSTCGAEIRNSQGICVHCASGT